MGNQEKILEALSGLIPEDTQDKVSAVINAAFTEAVAELEKEYETRLEEAYQQLTVERENDWKVAEEGYQQAYEHITDLRNRLDIQQQEFEQTLEEEYAKAYDMLVEERNKNQTLSEELYREYDEKLTKIKDWMIDRIDEFLAKKGDEYYEMARREVLNDPCVAEHRVAFEKVLEVASNFLSDEDYLLNTSSKVEELNRSLEQTKNQIRILESKNTKLMTENNQMQSYIRQTKELIEESMVNEQQERVEKARTVEGRGKVIAEPEREVVIGETTSTTTKDQKLVEHKEENGLSALAEQWQIIAGLKK